MIFRISSSSSSWKCHLLSKIVVSRLLERDLSVLMSVYGSSFDRRRILLMLCLSIFLRSNGSSSIVLNASISDHARSGSVFICFRSLCIFVVGATRIVVHTVFFDASKSLSANFHPKLCQTRTSFSQS